MNSFICWTCAAGFKKKLWCFLAVWVLELIFLQNFTWFDDPMNGFKDFCRVKWYITNGVILSSDGVQRSRVWYQRDYRIYIYIYIFQIKVGTGSVLPTRLSCISLHYHHVLESLTVQPICQIIKFGKTISLPLMFDLSIWNTVNIK